MKTLLFFTTTALVAALSAGAAAFASSNTPATVSCPLGAGSVTVWANGGRIVARIDDAALKSLPPAETRVDLPVEIGPFRLVEIDWNPHGHPPKGVYDVPHFDAHFYVIGKRERDAIPFGAPGSAAKPDASIVPAGYVTDGTVVPMMGMHFVPAGAPEFHGKPFTATQIWGYNQGHLAFIEVMFTKQFVDGNRTFQQPVAEPSRVAVDPLPKTMLVRRDGNGYDIVLTQ